MGSPFFVALGHKKRAFLRNALQSLVIFSEQLISLGEAVVRNSATSIPGSLT